MLGIMAHVASSAVDTAAFDYDLPPERVAQVPAEPRDAARLLVARQAVEHRLVRDLPELVAPGDLVVVNDTRVLPARLRVRKTTGGAVELLLLERFDDGRWEALVRPARRVHAGTELTPEGAPAGCAIVVAEDLGDGRMRVELTGVPGPGGEQAELDLLHKIGEVPLPPYITEPLADPQRYQTVYARRPSSAAAPTAGLHLTDTVLDGLRRRGATVATVELAVGLATFRPITVEQVEDHRMHHESYVVPEATWAALQQTQVAGGRVLAVGTTTMRALESVAATGARSGRTDLFIRRGHEFRAVDRLLTNFHTPRSSLLVLVDAFIGSRWRLLYEEALGSGYRFLSFGDAMLLDREIS
jgi:S-adenosylmethionine:tRNA ribosyltransferase-isomerase